MIDHLASDLRAEFPEMKGFSPRNLKYMRASARPGRSGNLCSRLLHDFVAEYALRNMTCPIGVAECRLVEALPTEARRSFWS